MSSNVCCCCIVTILPPLQVRQLMFQEVCFFRPCAEGKAQAQGMRGGPGRGAKGGGGGGGNKMDVDDYGTRSF